jgi:ABC-2 type transport system permease protein
MDNFFSLVKREFTLFVSNKIMKILYLGGPVLYGVLFGLVYAKGKFTDMPILVVDKDNSPLSAMLIDMLDDNNVLKVNEIRYESVDLKKIFMANAAYATVIIPYNFEADLIQGRQPELTTYINNTNLLPAGHVNRNITSVVATLNALRTAASGKKTEAFHVNTFRLFNRSGSYFMYIWPSYLAIILQSVVMVVLALSFASEQENNTLTGLYEKSRKSYLTLILSKLTLYWILAFIILAVYTLYFYLFRQQLPLHPLTVLLITYLFITTNCFIGMIVGLLFRSELKALQFLMILSMPIYISSGFSWPFDQGGWLAHSYSFLFPFMPFVNAFRILLIEQGGLEDVKGYVLLQLVQLSVYIAIAVAVLRYNVKRKAISVPFATE